MEIVRLKYFIQLAEVLNFTEASKHLFITQSTLSQSIRQAEEELGVKLFDRIGRKVYLTEAGRMFLPYARKTIVEMESGIQKLRDMQEIYTGELRIGVIYSMCPVLTESIHHFTKEYPKVKLVLTHSPSIIELAEMVIENKVDFALSYKPEISSPLIEATDLYRFPICLIVRNDSSLAKRKRISIKDIGNQNLVLLQPGIYTRSVIDKLSVQNGVVLHPMAEVNETSMLLQMVLTGHWVSILSQGTIMLQPNLKAIPLEELTETMHASLLWPKGAYHKVAARKFAEVIQRVSRHIDTAL